MILIGGLFIAFKTIKIGTKESMLKGLFMIIGYLTYCSGAFLNAVLGLVLIYVILSRVLLTAAAITLYLGFIMPKKAKKFLLKEE